MGLVTATSLIMKLTPHGEVKTHAIDSPFLDEPEEVVIFSGPAGKRKYIFFHNELIRTLRYEDGCSLPIFVWEKEE